MTATLQIVVFVAVFELLSVTHPSSLRGVNNLVILLIDITNIINRDINRNGNHGRDMNIAGDGHRNVTIDNNRSQ